MLEALPPDLLDKVLLGLELPDLYQLRLTSRHLERETSPTFGAEVFSTLRLDLSAQNLRWVRNIADHDRFRLAVRSLWLGDWDGKVTGAGHTWEASYGTSGHWPRLEDGRVDYNCEMVRQFVDCVARFENYTSVTTTDERRHSESVVQGS